VNALPSTRELAFAELRGPLALLLRVVRLLHAHELFQPRYEVNPLSSKNRIAPSQMKR